MTPQQSSAQIRSRWQESLEGYFPLQADRLAAASWDAVLAVARAVAASPQAVPQKEHPGHLVAGLGFVPDSIPDWLALVKLGRPLSSG